MELKEANGKFPEDVDKLAETMSQVGTAMWEMLLCLSEIFSAACKQWLSTVDLSPLTELIALMRLEEQRQEEDRLKAMELRLVSGKVVKLSKDKRTKVQKKNMARIRKEIRLYEKRKQR